MVARLQAKASQIGRILQTLEKKYDTKLDASELAQTPTSVDSGGGGGSRRNSGQSKKPTSTKFQIPPFNPNKVRKSPIGGVDIDGAVIEEQSQSEEISNEIKGSTTKEDVKGTTTTTDQPSQSNVEE